MAERPSGGKGLRTVADFVRFGASRFNEAGLCFAHGTDDAVDEALALVLHALHLSARPPLPAELFHARLTPGERREVRALLRRRIEDRVPAAYLTGEAWFAGLRFEIDRRVLVPRSPLAELIEGGFHPWVDAGRVRRVLDLGTGSGCIAVACARAFPEARVDRGRRVAGRDRGCPSQRRPARPRGTRPGPRVRPLRWLRARIGQPGRGAVRFSS